MRTRARIVVAAVAVALLAGVLWRGLAPGEPSYQGKGLSAWIEQDVKYFPAKPNSPDRAKRDEAEAAIRQMGTNTLPTLLKMVRAKDSPLKANLLLWSSKQSVIKFHFRSASDYHAWSTYGFGALGPIAKPAVPALVDALQDKDDEVCATAANCLACIGREAKEAAPALVQLLNNRRNGVAIMESMMALGSSRAEPETVVPLLLEYVNGPRQGLNYSEFAIDALGLYGTNAEVAVPVLEELVSNPTYQGGALDALDRIDRKAGERANEMRMQKNEDNHEIHEIHEK
jgi:hypothetical protein